MPQAYAGVGVLGNSDVGRAAPASGVDARARLVLGQRRRAGDVAALHLVVVLRDGQRVPLAGLAQRQAPVPIHGVGRRPQGVGVEAGAGRRAGPARPPVAERDAHRALGVAGHDQDRRPHGPPVHSRARPRRRRPARAARRCAARASRALSQVSVVSGFGKLLEPAVVGEPAVVDRRVGPEDDLQRCLAPCPRPVARAREPAGPRRVAQSGASADTGSAGAPCPRPGRRAGSAARSCSKSPPGLLRLPGRLDDVVAGALRRCPRGPPAARGPSGRRRAARSAAARSDRAVVGAGVAPGFERMGLRDVPEAARRRLVVVEAEVDAERHLRQRLGEAEVGGRRVGRVAAQDQPASGRGRPACRRPVAASVADGSGRRAPRRARCTRRSCRRCRARR